MSESKRRHATAVATLRLPADPRLREWMVAQALVIAIATRGTVVLRSTVPGESGILFVTHNVTPTLEATTDRPKPWQVAVAQHMGIGIDSVTVVGHVQGQEVLW